jgi:hypothetical protein
MASIQAVDLAFISVIAAVLIEVNSNHALTTIHSLRVFLDAVGADIDPTTNHTTAALCTELGDCLDAVERVIVEGRDYDGNSILEGAPNENA